MYVKYAMHQLGVKPYSADFKAAHPSFKMTGCMQNRNH